MREVQFPKPPASQYQRFGPVGPYYPQRAADARLRGAALIQCKIASSGKLSSCQILQERPTDENFGIAAVVMARRGWIVAAPLGVDEAQSDGQLGRLLVVFDPRKP